MGSNMIRSLKHCLGIAGSKSKWNFHKYLISREASKVLAFDSARQPDDKELLRKIDEFIQ